jgi:hypothetical protein
VALICSWAPRNVEYLRTVRWRVSSGRPGVPDCRCQQSRKYRICRTCQLSSHPSAEPQLEIPSGHRGTLAADNTFLIVTWNMPENGSPTWCSASTTMTGRILERAKRRLRRRMDSLGFQPVRTLLSQDRSECLPISIAWGGRLRRRYGRRVCPATGLRVDVSDCVRNVTPTKEKNSSPHTSVRRAVPHRHPSRGLTAI